MTKQEIFESLIKDPDIRWNARIIQALVSNIELSIENNLDPQRIDYTANKVRSRIYEGVVFFNKFAQDINFEFPPHFLETCIFAYSGEKSRYHLEQLGLEFDEELAQIMVANGWLPEHYRKEQK